LICLVSLTFALGSVFTGASHAADPGLVGCWMFDEGSGTTAFDSSGNGNDGTLVLADGAVSPAWVSGKYGSALSFDGVDDYVALTAQPPITNGFTFTAWVRRNGDSPSTQEVFNNHRFFLRTMPENENSNNPFEAFVNLADGSVEPRAQSNVASTVGQWFFVAATWDKTTLRIYVDGELKGSSTRSGELSSTTVEARIGRGEQTNVNANPFNGLIDEVALFDVVLEAEDIEAIMNNGLAGIIPGQPFAIHPSPGNEATDVLRDADLSWSAGAYAATHDVYVGESFEEVDAAAVPTASGLDVASFDPGRLELGKTYFWRVDEVNGAPDYTVFKGEVWSFTVEPFAYPIAGVIATSNASSDAGAGPENTVNGSGLNASDQHSIAANDMWLTVLGQEGVYIQYEFDRVYKLHEMLVWNYNVQFEPVLGFGLKSVTIEYSENGTDWTALGDVEFAKATAKATYTANTTVGFGGVAAKYVRLSVSSGWGMLGQYGLSEVRFLYIPTQPREPQPAGGATGVDPETTLSWRRGREAASHEVYLSMDPNALTLAGTVDSASFVPALEFGSTYYWQIVEVNEADTVTAWAGDVWSFSTKEYALIEGFETYDDDIDAGTTIFGTWLDGWVNDNGSTVGYLEAPFAEQNIVRTGRQSMPLQYDNSASPFYSEAERTFDSAQNWSVYGADTLLVCFQGVPMPFTELASGKIVMGAAGTDIWNAADQFRFAYKPLSGDGSIVALVESVSRAVDWTKAGVMIRETLEAGSKFAAVYATPDYGCRYQARLTADVAAVSDSGVVTTEQTALRAPYWVKVERVGNTFNGYYSTDGQNWTAMAWNPQTISMGANVYIGLAITSHSAGVLASAEFSGVATTGNVNGAWLVETIGIEQPEGNDADPLYVTLEDAAGKAATVSHPAGDSAVLLAGWNEWLIPMSQFTGVNLSRIEVFRIGVGNRANPTAGGTGIVYIDDIGFGRPAATE